ncbi:glycosyltransferase family 2 protein [Patescibacteria group bacterium]|nr:glycosyltransferase family 2 protein [Patescibacteria group bacterium]
MNSKLIIQIVTWNSLKFLKECLDSVFNQTFKSFSVLIIDNGSNDKTVDFIRKNYSKEKIKEKFKKTSKIFIFQNNKNLGFSRAHNQGLFLAQSEFVLVLNPDVILEPDFLTKLMRKAVKEKKIGSFAGKLLRIKSGDVELEEKIKTDIIDTTGFKIFKNRHIIDRGQRQKDKKQYDKETNVFGVSGACALYRRQALEDVKLPIIRNSSKFVIRKGKERSDWEYFDEDFFAYQEDMDMAWRLQLKAWPCLYVPQAKAYHYRGVGGKENIGLFELAKLHWQRSKTIEYLSYRNHLWLLLKNSYLKNIFYHFFVIFFYQLGKRIYLLFTKPKVLLKVSFCFWKNLAKMYKKRKIIMKNAKVDAKQMRKWIE